MKRAAAGAGFPALAAALGLHGLALGALLVLPSPVPDVAEHLPPVRIRLAPPPKPPPPEPPPPELEPAPKTEPRPEPVQRQKQRPRPKPKPKPEPRRVQTPDPGPPAPKPPPKFTVSMEATVPGGGVAVPTAPRSRSRAGSVDGGEKGDQTSGGPVPIAELTELPRLLAQPSQSAMRAVYPEAARRDGTEADVQLRLLVGRNGRVSQVRILRRAGKGFDRVAVRLVKRFRFRPGRRGGQPVPVWIPWTYKFRLAE